MILEIAFYLALGWLLGQRQDPLSRMMRRAEEDAAYAQYGAAVLRPEGFNMHWTQRP